MDGIVFLTVLGAALMHASWNALVKAGADRFAFTIVLTLAECVMGLALAPFFPAISPAALPWLLLSGALHVGYMLFLTEAYAHGDLAQIYPLARGSAPLIVALVGVLAVLLGALLVPHAQARVTTGALAAAFGLVLVPGVTELGFRTVGLGPTLWRLSFGLTIGALVGVAAARLWQTLHRRTSQPRAILVAALVAALVVGFGHPIWSRATSSSWQPPFHWQRSDASRDAAAAAVREAGPGGLVLAPDDLAITVVISQTEVRTVAPRDYYMAYLRNDPRFHYDDRLTLVRMVNGSGPWTEPAADGAL